MKDIFTIKNCKIVNEGDIFEGDVLVKEGRFLKIGSDIESQGETIDAAGLFLFPGVIAVSYTHLTLPTTCCV